MNFSKKHLKVNVRQIESLNENKFLEYGGLGNNKKHLLKTIEIYELQEKQ